MSAPTAMFAHVKRFLKRWTVPQDRLLVAVSGGADSVGLLSVLMDEIGMKRERIIVGHVNHGLRQDAFIDEKLVRQLCGQRDLVFTCRRVDTPGLARSRKLSMEAAARKLRYDAFAQLASEQGCRWILTGHTLDDSAETVLLRMLSGAPWYEWTGIPSRRGQVLRPLIQVRRIEIRNYVELRNLGFRDDPSNIIPCHLRNKLRLCLLRKQEFWDDSKICKIAKTGQFLWWTMEGYREAARRMLLFNARGSGRFGLEIERILGYFNSLTFVPVEVAWSLLSEQLDARLPSAIRRQIADFLRGHRPQAYLHLPLNIIVQRRGQHVDVYPAIDLQNSYRVALGDTVIPEQMAVFSLSLTPPSDRNYTAAIDRKFLDHELELRSWRPGDRIKPAQRPIKKIADLLAERKLNSQERAQALVLADEDGPLWLISGPVAERALPQTNDLSPLWVSWKAHHGT